ncbi:sensor histidine kinase [Kitasatospora sp. NPDC050543]|uniref:sensor histidine kinase n=1 Tax=Kitasatospora sp. NPDC050543 TaxID=3364054 RepID=UPI003794D071
MPRIIAPLFAAATYVRWLHLLIGAVFAGVVLLVYPGTEGVSTLDAIMWSVPIDSTLLTLAALVPGMRRAEGVQARLLLMPDREEDIGAGPSRGPADLRRTALWLIGRVALGMAVAVLSINTLTVGTLLLTAPGRDNPLVLYGHRLPAGLDPWCPLLVPPLLFSAGWLLVWAGRFQLAMAVRLLGPSPAERLAEAELRAERLLERNRLARELHDSIGHALTVTVLQAGAAREVGDQAFVAKALEVIEETGRQAMDDLERTLVLLRDSPDATAAEHPGIDQLPRLFETARAAGSLVEAWIDIPRGQLPGVLSREAYRIVQEAVTNALRHAPGEPLSVRIAVRDGQLELRMANSATGPGQTRRGGGKGLRGVRERASLLGGEATAGREEDTWVLAVRLPLRLGA